MKPIINVIACIVSILLISIPSCKKEKSNRRPTDIYDYTTQYWSVANLSRATILAGAASSDQRICFFGDKWVDIYNASSNTWSTAELPVSISDGSAIIAAGANIYVADRDRVWRVEF